MKCPYCGQEHPDNAKFCMETGQRLIPQNRACPNADCPDFGKYILPLEAKFCPRCGAKLEDESVNEEVATQLSSIIRGLIMFKSKNNYVSYCTGKYKFVDLGLTHKWSICNLGAENPTDLGCYYAWGEIRPKVKFSEDNHPFMKKKRFILDDIYRNIGDKISGTRYDPVTYLLKNKKFHMPTYIDMFELVKKCRWYLLGHAYKIVGPNGNYIVLPFYDRITDCGVILNDYLCGDIPLDMNPTGKYVQVLNLTDSQYTFCCRGGRFLGRLVRPVCDI